MPHLSTYPPAGQCAHYPPLPMVALARPPLKARISVDPPLTSLLSLSVINFSLLIILMGLQTRCNLYVLKTQNLSQLCPPRLPPHSSEEVPTLPLCPLTAHPASASRCESRPHSGSSDRTLHSPSAPLGTVHHSLLTPLLHLAPGCHTIPAVPLSSASSPLLPCPSLSPGLASLASPPAPLPSVAPTSHRSAPLPT